MSNLYKASITWVLLPLIVGVIVFALWFFTRMEILMQIGLLTLIGGLVSVAIGFSCLAIYLFQERDKNASSKTLRKKELLFGGLVIFDFLAAFIIICAAIYLETINTLIIKNQSPSIISNVTIKAPGVNIDTGPILSNKKVSLKFHVKGDGDLRFTATQNSIEYSGLIEGYVISGDKYILTVDDVNKYEVRKL